MTIKEKLMLMQEIKAKNDHEWAAAKWQKEKPAVTGTTAGSHRNHHETGRMDIVSHTPLKIKRKAAS